MPYATRRRRLLLCTTTPPPTPRHRRPWPSPQEADAVSPGGRRRVAVAPGRVPRRPMPHAVASCVVASSWPKDAAAPRHVPRQPTP
ncbi:hypothetical protein GUJ93_ZPchr0001g31756 [Zizania palustris]|uniref:Uncharacterized protein n=1 Tax=Zizania palustris TaxID=103762 RepID=A0A8J5RSL0_ZIZPA|nr:hypothetical protein GUJ93_ZPchr0001g31756 [Zizania palustris]